MNKLAIGCGVVFIILLLIVLIVGGMIVGRYNSLVAGREAVKKQWGNVENVYQRRADLIPNLVATVKGYAKHEKETLAAVVEARAKVGQVKLSADMLSNPEAFKQFSQAQTALSSALSRLMVVVERYPDLKANQNFLALQSQLEGTENRIAVERRRFNEFAGTYNTAVQSFPANIIASLFNFEKFEYFKAKQGADKVPEVKF